MSNECAVCRANKQAFVDREPTVTFVCRQDTYGSRFFSITVPLCDEHRGWPGLIETRIGEKLA
jgi:hypothetical protein